MGRGAAAREGANGVGVTHRVGALCGEVKRLRRVAVLIRVVKAAAQLARSSGVAARRRCANRCGQLRPAGGRQVTSSSAFRPRRDQRAEQNKRHAAGERIALGFHTVSRCRRRRCALVTRKKAGRARARREKRVACFFFNFFRGLVVAKKTKALNHLSQSSRQQHVRRAAAVGGALQARALEALQAV